VKGTNEMLQNYFNDHGMKPLFPLIFAAALAGCGEIKDDRHGRATQDANASAPPSKDTTVLPMTPPTGVRLKGAGLLAQSLYRTIGPGKDKAVGDGSTPEENLLATYRQNFGDTEGLRFGEVYADSPSTSYLLALATVGANAASRCQEELAQAGDSLCRCDTMDAARALLGRAFPALDLNAPSAVQLTQKFQQACASDNRGAIASLISSIGFASRD